MQRQSGIVAAVVLPYFCAEADRIVSAMAARLRDMGLPTDTVVGIQPDIANPAARLNAMPICNGAEFRPGRQPDLRR
jgi:hypothetical protein